MKNIFKKNQIIITALAIMIAVAGYLSFTNKDKAGNDLNTVETTNADLTDYEEYSDLDENELSLEETDADEAALNEAAENTTGIPKKTGKDANAANTVETEAIQKNEAAKAPVQEKGAKKTESNKKLSVDVAKDSSQKAKGASADALLSKAKDVTDNGELKPEEGVPGEAILASATQDEGFFATSKLKREQLRANNIATLKEVIENSKIAGKDKKNAVNSLLKLTEIADKEDAAEMSLGAKGFNDSVVRICEDKVEVVVNAPSLTQQQLAIIEDIVKKKTDITVENIQISPVIIED